MAKRRRKTIDARLRRFLTSDVIRLHRRRHNIVKIVCACWIERTKQCVAPAIYKHNTFRTVPLRGIPIFLTVENKLLQLCMTRQSRPIRSLGLFRSVPVNEGTVKGTRKRGRQKKR